VHNRTVLDIRHEGEKGRTAISLRKRLGQRLDTYPMCRIPVKCVVVLRRVADNAAPCEMSPKYVQMAQTISVVPSIISVCRRDRPNRDCAELAGCGNMVRCCPHLIEGVRGGRVGLLLMRLHHGDGAGKVSGAFAGVMAVTQRPIVSSRNPLPHRADESDRHDHPGHGVNPATADTPD
jgi:hypothetical protein